VGGWVGLLTLIYSHTHPHPPGAEGRTNRRLNFQNTRTKLSIPHEYVQRTVLSNKHPTPASRTEALVRSDSSSSLDSALRTTTTIGKFVVPFIILFILK
jgi:hypothetical protein